MTKTTPTTASRFRQLVDDEDVPAPPSDAEGRRNYWIETLFEGVHLLRKRMRSGDPKEAMKALEMVMKLEGMMMRHHMPLTGTGCGDLCGLEPLPSFTPKRGGVKVEEEPPAWVPPSLEEEVEEEMPHWTQIATAPPTAPAAPPAGTKYPPEIPRIDPFAPRPPGAPRAIVDGPPLEPRMSDRDYHLLLWKREDPERYHRFMANVGGEPESMKQYSG